ncbi:hypothetical protein C0J52_24694 [Blattella germanica]|nr:hypothetical protein C0J52_24694 [Blattella germanica]
MNIISSQIFNTRIGFFECFVMTFTTWHFLRYLCNDCYVSTVYKYFNSAMSRNNITIHSTVGLYFTRHTPHGSHSTFQLSKIKNKTDEDCSIIGSFVTDIYKLSDDINDAIV